MIKKICTALMAFFIVFFLSACGGSFGIISPTTSEAVETTPIEEPSYASTMTDAVLKALDRGDYESFIAAMNDEMKQALTPQLFNKMHEQFETTIGTYTGEKTYIMTHVDGENTTVIYQAAYTEEPDGVNISITFTDEGDGIKISGLYFGSPKLRGE